MTSKEQTIADDKMRAEISKLIAETSKINKEIPALTAKLAAETAQLNVETNYYVLFRGIALGAALLGAGAAVSKIFL